MAEYTCFSCNLTRRDLCGLIIYRFPRNCLLEFKYALELGASFLYFDVIIQQNEYCLNSPQCGRLFVNYWRLSL